MTLSLKFLSLTIKPLPRDHAETLYILEKLFWFTLKCMQIAIINHLRVESFIRLSQMRRNINLFLNVFILSLLQFCKRLTIFERISQIIGGQTNQKHCSHGNNQNDVMPGHLCHYCTTHSMHTNHESFGDNL